MRVHALGAACALALALVASGSNALAQTGCEDPDLRRTAGPVSLAFADPGDATRPAVLLIAGTDQQLTDWPASLIEGLKARGFRPVVYDARDVGCSTGFAEAGAPDWAAFFGKLMSGQTPETAYTLGDLTADAVAVADAADLDRFHILAASGGTAVAASLARDHPDRVASLVLFAANSGDPAIPMPAEPQRLATIPPPPPADAPADAITAYRIAAAQALEGSTLRTPELDLRARAVAATARAWNPDGTARTGAALIAAGDLRPIFRQLSVPAVVVHGEEDPLISIRHGRQVAEAIPNAAFKPVAGLGHSLPDAATEALLQAFDEAAAQTSSAPR